MHFGKLYKAKKHLDQGKKKGEKREREQEINRSTVKPFLGLNPRMNT